MRVNLTPALTFTCLQTQLPNVIVGGNKEGGCYFSRAHEVSKCQTLLSLGRNNVRAYAGQLVSLRALKRKGVREVQQIAVTNIKRDTHKSRNRKLTTVFLKEKNIVPKY
jgi:hypothetical protein